MELKGVVGELQAEIERYNLLGFRPQEVAEKAAQLDAYVDRFRARLSELEDLGVSVKDLNWGLVDFPAERFGKRVCLCWRYGESDVSYWHSPDEGYNSRMPLKTQLIQP